MQNEKSATTNLPIKGMVKDLNDSLISKDVISSARNAVMNSHLGDVPLLSTEPTNTFCAEFPYPFNGSVPLLDKRHLIFSTDNTHSEIGILEETHCTYTTLINQDDLGFHSDHPISGRAKESFLSGSEVVTFTDNLNPIRRLDLGNIPHTFTEADDACRTKTFTTTVDVPQLNLFRQIAIPTIAIAKVPTGSLPNGAYQVAIAYFVNDQRYSDYYDLSIPVQLFDQSGTAGGLSVTIGNLDQDFDQYGLVLIHNVKGAETRKRIGIFPTAQSHVSISEVDRPEYIPIPLTDLIVTKINYERAGIISGNARYLMFADLIQKPKLNYQLLSAQIQAQYIVYQVPLDYYAIDGSLIGHWRDEVYSYYLRFFWDDGEPTESIFLSGRKAEGDEKITITGDDVYEYDGKTTLPKPKAVYKWQAYNTAQPMIRTNNAFVNNMRQIGYGKLGYHESSRLYPDNPALFGEDACTPIRHHRFPDESIVPRYAQVNGQTYINILGIQFSSIPHPVDANGNPIQAIKSYEILRADRSGGNRTVIARGMLSNVRSYTDTVQDQAQEVLYANYPYNDLHPDVFLSSTPVTNKSGNEAGTQALTTYKKDQFTFYTPHAYFNNKYRMGREFIIESEEIATVTGHFEPVYNHPKHKLLTNFSLYFAVLAGAIEGYLSTTGKKTITTQYNQIDAGGTAIGTSITGVSSSTPPGASIYPTKIISEADSMFKRLSIPQNLSVIQITERVLIIALQALVAVGAFVYASSEYAANALRIITGFSSYSQYAYQYVSKGTFRSQASKVQKGNKRRYALRQPQYLSSAVQSVNSTPFNNFGKQESIYVHFNRELTNPTTTDDTRKTMTAFGNSSSPSRQVTSTASMYYATSKTPNPSQYGEIGSPNKVKTSTNVIPFSGNAPYITPALFGGDCIIAPFSLLTKQPLFQQNLAGSNYPDGTEFNYSLYRNIGYPRFWADTTSWQIGDLVTKSPALTRLPGSKYNLDAKGNAAHASAWTVQDRYFYLYINGVMDFIAEADYNISFRQETPATPFYSSASSSLTEIFRSDRITRPEQFLLDTSFYKLQADQLYSPSQDTTLDPTRYNQVHTHEPNALIYSLPAFTGTKVDNWQYFLPGNYFTFDQNDFGTLTTIKQLDQDRVIFLFDKASPYVSFGQDELQTTSGRVVTIGDGGLFARPPKELQHTDVHYGNSKSRYAFSTTQYGCFYPSFSQGRIFNFTGQFDEISARGLHFWCQQYMPIQLYQHFPDYPQLENPFSRVGYFMFFDNTYKTIYIVKKDYIPQSNIADITYDPVTDQFFSAGNPISLTNTNYFEDVGWTLSYSPEGKCFISYHDWRPDGVIQTEQHFITIKGNTAWKHNEATDSFCNFYGKDYPFEVELSSSTGEQVHILDSLEYILEGIVYKNNGQDKFHNPLANFDKLIVRNSEQVSGLLTLVPETFDVYTNDTYPLFNGSGYNVLYSRVENKYRIAQFDDITRDRGDFTGNQYPLLFSHPSGYRYIINPTAINFTKPADERKPFRHYTNFVWLSKSVVGATRLTLKWVNLKRTLSRR